MAFLGSTFDATTVDPARPRDVLPPGKYVAQIINSELKPTRGGGQMLALEMEITQGEFAKRRIFDNLNLVNSNAKAVEIAERTLSAIAHAIGVLHFSDSEQLHFKEMEVTVRVEADGRDKDLPADEQRKQNAVSGYAPVGNAAAGARSAPRQPQNTGGATRTQPQTQQQAQPQTQPQQQTGAAVPAWRRNRTAA